MSLSRITDSPIVAQLDRPIVRGAGVAIFVLFLLFARRYAQMLNPQVWQEEGLIVSQAVTHGVASLFIPLAGYLVVAARLVSLVALLAPFKEYPRAATLLTWSFIVAVCSAIALVPTRLAGGLLLAVSLLLVPSAAEVFGVPLYTFWWTVPLLYASYFWIGRGPILKWRIATIVLSGLSAPTIVLVMPLFVLRALLDRTRSDIAAAVAAVGCSVIQLLVIFIALKAGDTSVGHPGADAIPLAVEKLFGGYLVWNLQAPDATRASTALVVGSLSLLFVAAALWREPQLRTVLLALVYLWLGSSYLSISRVDVHIIDQYNAGPRYYFLPFAMEGWVLLQIALSARSATFRGIALAMLLCAAFNALPVLSRTHDDLDWKDAVSICASQPLTVSYAIPIQSNGIARDHWDMSLTGHQCHRLERFGLLGLIR